MASATTRERMIVSAALVMRERGVDATSFSEVIERSRAPRGSIYHYFPGGKAQLIEEATHYAGEFTAAGLVAALDSDEPVVAVHDFAETWTEILEQSHFGAGCPVVSAALEGDRAPGARGAAADAFRRWERLLAAALERHTGQERAASLATLIIAAIEGAVVVARAQRSTQPVRHVAAELERVVGTALAGG
jgi:AcrR family transcriptional regulator